MYRLLRKEPAMRTFAVICLSIVFVVLFIGGFALGIYGFGSTFGAFPAPQFIPPIGVVGVILFLASIGVSGYIWMKFPEMRSHYYTYDRRRW
jgi:hypothetical protein